MIETMYFKQDKPITIKILGVVILSMAAFIAYDGNAPWNQMITMSVIGVLLLGYSISYEIKTDFDNRKHFALFGFTIFKQQLNIIFPDYIAVFSARFKQSADWGPIAAMGKENSDSLFVVRLFKENRQFTVFKTNSLDEAKTKANRLGKIINVGVRVKA